MPDSSARLHRFLPAPQQESTSIASSISFQLTIAAACNSGFERYHNSSSLRRFSGERSPSCDPFLTVLGKRQEIGHPELSHTRVQYPFRLGKNATELILRQAQDDKDTFTIPSRFVTAVVPMEPVGHTFMARSAASSFRCRLLEEITFVSSSLI